MIKHIEINIMRVYSSVLIFFIIIKTKANTLTTDEAYTFLEYVYTGDVFNIGIANNHLLNTFLMFFSTKLGYSEIFLRLPNLFAGIVYIVLSFFISKKTKYPLLSLTILTAVPYLVDFFTLARGYGIACTSIFLGLINYYFFRDYKFKFLVSIFFLVLASLSIHIYITYTLIFFSLNVINEYKLNKTTVYLTSIILFYFSYNIIIWTFQISQGGKPMFGAQEVDLIYLSTTFFGLMNLYHTQSLLIYILIFLSVFILPIFLFKYLSGEMKVLFFLNHLTLLSLYVLPLLFGKTFPSQRILLPLIPAYLIISIVSIDVFRFNLKYMKNFNFLIVAVMILNLIQNSSINSTIDWGTALNKEALVEFSSKDLDCEYIMPDIRSAQYYRLLLQINEEPYCSVNGEITNFEK